MTEQSATCSFHWTSGNGGAGLGPGTKRQILTTSSSDPASLASMQQVVDFAICIERCGDVLTGKFLTLRLDQLRGSYQFTDEGTREIAEMVEAVRRTIILAHETAWTGDALPAERLVRHKQHVRTWSSEAVTVIFRACEGVISSALHQATSISRSSPRSRRSTARWRRSAMPFWTSTVD